MNNHYADIIAWKIQPSNPIPTLFIKGEKSPYVAKPEHFEAIESQFSNAKIEVVEGVGHWLHAEKPAVVNGLIAEFIG